MKKIDDRLSVIPTLYLMFSNFKDNFSRERQNQIKLEPRGQDLKDHSLLGHSAIISTLKIFFSAQIYFLAILMGQLSSKVLFNCAIISTLKIFFLAQIYFLAILMGQLSSKVLFNNMFVKCSVIFPFLLFPFFTFTRKDSTNLFLKFRERSKLLIRLL